MVLGGHLRNPGRAGEASPERPARALNLLNNVCISQILVERGSIHRRIDDHNSNRDMRKTLFDHLFGKAATYL